MMVSKVAVMAIVGILAVPILLGYALNVEQVTETDYQITGDSINVSQLLQSGTEYTYANADIYQLNTNFEEFSLKCIPVYQSVSSNRTSYKMNVDTWTLAAGSYFVFNYNNIISTFYIYFGENSNVTFIDLEGGTISHTTVNNVIALYYDPITNVGKVLSPGGAVNPVITTTFTPYNINDYLFFENHGTSDRTVYVARDLISGNQYVDFSAGYTFNFVYTGEIYAGENYDDAVVRFPNYTKNALITIDLDSITDPNYSFGIGTQCYIEKTTTDGVVSWQVKPRPRISDNIVPVTDLYYDPNSSNNTYQIKIWVDPNGEPSSIPGYNEYIQHYEFRYVGNWPTLIGETNYYQSFDIEAKLTAQTPNFNFLMFGGFSAKSPIMRVDNAEYRAMEYQVISDKIYDPSSFKTNPSTTINDVTLYGKSFTFGGNTYAVKKGNITLGNHDIPVKGLVLSSVPNTIDGGYDNKIGNTVISNTPNPSTITFNGKWSASISTIAQEEYEITKTEWEAGDFAWNAIDENFIMAGLLASLGAFIGLGIYARRSRASIWPLLIVCGGAALMFFIML